MRPVFPLLALLAAGCPKNVPPSHTSDDNAWIESAPGAPAVCIAALPQAGPMAAKERAAWWRAVEHLRAGDAIAAQGDLTRAGSHPSVMAAKAATSLLYGEGDRAERRIAPLLEDFGDDPCLLQAGALAARQAGDVVVAVDRARRATELAPEDTNATLILAAALAEIDPEAGWEAAGKLIEQYPEQPVGYQIRATLALQAGDIERAIPPLEKLRALGQPVESNLVQAYRLTDRVGDAVRMYAEQGERLGDGGRILEAADPEAAFYEALGLEEGQDLVATIRTSKGTLRCTLFPREAPLTVANFVGLARGTIAWTDPSGGEHDDPLYPGTVFHRAIPDFMIQGGDPRGDGTGGPGYRFLDEIHPAHRFDRPGVLAMANSGPATNGSQFFVTEDPASHLDGKHTIFGQCDEASLGVVRTIARVPKVSGDLPLEPVVIEYVTIAAVEPPSPLMAP